MSVDRASDYHYNTTITLEYGKLDTVLEWCKETCEDRWAWNIANNPGTWTFTFYFKQEKDFATFLLRWTK